MMRALPDDAPVHCAIEADDQVAPHLVHDRGWPRRSAIVKPFWTPGKRGMD